MTIILDSRDASASKNPPLCIRMGFMENNLVLDYFFYLILHIPYQEHASISYNKIFYTEKSSKRQKVSNMEQIGDQELRKQMLKT